ncbi:MAG: RNA-binding domain-containing protein [bacterium]
MRLPISIKQLFNSKVIETERLELKKGWNPQDIIHSLCAFANDINNFGGGYIVVGIDEKNGLLNNNNLGLNENEIDKIQKELYELSHKILPNYFPISSIEKFEDKILLIIWCPGGEARPYKAPKELGKKNEYKVYVRRGALTVEAKREDENTLYEVFPRLPFDDRININSNIENLDKSLISSFLKEVKSELYNDIEKVSFVDLCKQMNIVRGPDEYLKPINCGLLFFYLHPEKYFKGAKIEIVHYKDSIGDKFSENIFSGPLQYQIKAALLHIKNSVITEEIVKVPYKAEALRYFNYPFIAVEEALVNAVYHRSYEDLNSIEISIFPDKIQILSFPGPLPPVDNIELKKNKVIARNYRNRRIGDFLKELDLTEGRSTGIPKIRMALKNNGSPEPLFETNAMRDYFLVTIFIHPESVENKEINHFIMSAKEDVPPYYFSDINDIQPNRGLKKRLSYRELFEQEKDGNLNDKMQNQRKSIAFRNSIKLNNIQTEILTMCEYQNLSTLEISIRLGYDVITRNVKNALTELLAMGLLMYLFPEIRRSSKQKFVITNKGKSFLYN